MPTGSFVLRLSGSRRRCLALSVRVDEGMSGRALGGICHYLIVKNESGYRIKVILISSSSAVCVQSGFQGSKHYFLTLPMLVTHHTVISEQLPCRLVFTDWRAQQSTTHHPQHQQQMERAVTPQASVRRAGDCVIDLDGEGVDL